MPELDSRTGLQHPFTSSSREDEPEEDGPASEFREGLPKTYRPRHDLHYVEQLTAATETQPVRLVPVSRIDSADLPAESTVASLAKLRSSSWGSCSRSWCVPTTDASAHCRAAPAGGGAPRRTDRSPVPRPHGQRDARVAARRGRQPALPASRIIVVDAGVTTRRAANIDNA